MKKLIKYIIIQLLLVVSFHTVHAQQTAQYTLNSFNKYIVNPAVVGTEDFVDIKASFRTQWTGLKGAPKTAYLTAHSPLGKDHGTGHNHRKNEKSSWFGVGGTLINDDAGAFNKLSAYGTGSYDLQISQKIRASFGLSLGIQNVSFSGSDIALTDLQDASFNNSSKLLPDAQAGVLLYGESFYFGFSSQQLLNNDLVLTEGNTATGGSLNRHFALMTGVNIPAGDLVKLYPSILVRSVVPAPVTVDVGLRATYDSKYWLGAFVRTSDSFSLALGGLFLKNYSVTYSYDFNYSELSPFNGGSHEILLGYRIPPKLKVDCPSKFWN